MLTNLSQIQRDCLLSNFSNQTYSIELTVINTTHDDDARKVLMFKNITEKRALESQLSNLENYDPLTRLLTRKSFVAEVKHLIDIAHKHNSSHVLAYFSIDQFQAINDTIGYASGDNLIVSISEKLSEQINLNVDIIGRVSGNEFAIVFTDCKLPNAIRSIQKILKSVAEHELMSRGQQFTITMSSGFVLIDTNTTSPTRAISEANRACDLASKRGGNSLLAYKEDNTEMQKLEGSLEWVMIIKKALKENRFNMHAQAIHPLNAKDYKKPFYHYELLLRLSDEKENQISPDEFIAAAEYYSMMPSLDKWVVKHVFKSISSIPDQNPLPVFAINLSGQSLNDPQFLTFVQQEIKKSGVHPQMLCFEITEQVAVEDLNSINTFIATMKALGCKFSLDDFGTGVSSYSYLRSLNVDYLKIDGIFVKHIVHDDVARAMVQSINQVGHTMDLKIIAEYVENDQILKTLRDMGVDYGQGYQIAKPRALNQVIETHKKNEFVYGET